MMLSLCRKLLANQVGGTAVIFALLVPAIAVLACGAIDLGQVASDRSAMQDAADATAIAMAKQLGVGTNSGISARATAYADAQLGPIASNDTVTVSTSIASDNSSVTVTVNGLRGSFFGSLLPPGGWRLSAAATARVLGQTPLCVLTSGTATGISLGGSSSLHAPGCLVQSDANIDVVGSATLNAGLAQAVGLASGSISPTPQNGAPSIADPFASLSIDSSEFAGCTPTDVVYSSGVNVLAPGMHCGNISVKNGATLQLQPGEHYFTGGGLSLFNNATLIGDDVALIFDSTAAFGFHGSSNISLGGRQSGRFSGFVIATTRDNTSTFEISSSSAHKLEGAIYIPAGTLEVKGVNNQVADQSAWTVVVAHAIETTGSPNLVVNANYASSSVPTPPGVGTSGATTSVALAK